MTISSSLFLPSSGLVKKWGARDGGCFMSNIHFREELPFFYIASTHMSCRHLGSNAAFRTFWGRARSRTCGSFDFFWKYRGLRPIRSVVDRCFSGGGGGYFLEVRDSGCQCRDCHYRSWSWSLIEILNDDIDFYFHLLLCFIYSFRTFAKVCFQMNSFTCNPHFGPFFACLIRTRK